MKRSYSQAFNTAATVVGAATGAYRAYKRARSFTHTRTVRRVPRMGDNFNQGYTIHNRKAVNTKKYRKRVSRGLRIRRMKYKKSKLAGIAGKLMEKIQKRLVLLNEMEIERGRVLLANCSQASTTNFLLPLHLYDLTNVSYNPMDVTRALYYTSSDVVPSDPIVTQYGFGSGLYKKLVTDGETTNSNVYVGSSNESTSVTRCPQGANDARKWYMHDAQIDLMMYGQTDADTLYRVDIVKFDPEFAEWVTSQTSLNQDMPSGNGFNAGDWKTFWHSLVAPYTQNPLIKRSRGKYMKILKSYKFKIPEMSGDYQKIPCVKTKIRFPVNRVLDRYWHIHADNVDFTANVNPESSTALNRQDYGAYNAQQYGDGYVRPKDRIFLMIRATNTDQRPFEADNSILVGKGDDPTYDISIRTNFSFNPT